MQIHPALGEALAADRERELRDRTRRAAHVRRSVPAGAATTEGKPAEIAATRPRRLLLALRARVRPRTG